MKNFRYSKMLLSLIFVGMLIVSVKTNAQSAKTDFTGTWALDEGKSQLGEGPGRRAAAKMAIAQMVHP
ncbi:MAG: hypothetical protein HC905_22785 [Bacteroidales bacterium]|nr:hypothetical protein [Bacteroidales bacterium]